MSTATTLAGYGAALAVVFGGAVGVGSAVGPVGSVSEHAAGTASAPHPLQGLAVAQDGYRLDLQQFPSAVGGGTLAFRIAGPDGRPVTRYRPQHERDLHLVVVRRDAAGFQHLHPQLAADGTWSTPLTLPTAGTYKVMADFLPAGRDDALTLATDVTVPGQLPPATSAPVEQRQVEVDGYTVALAGALTPGTSSELALTVTRAGRPVRDLDPYLGAYGHLVALRDGDLAYLHVHPEHSTGSGPSLTFAVDVPTSGVYRLFLDFSHEGTVRTAALSLPATGSAPTTAPQGHGHP